VKYRYSLQRLPGPGCKEQLSRGSATACGHAGLASGGRYCETCSLTMQYARVFLLNKVTFPTHWSLRMKCAGANCWKWRQIQKSQQLTIQYKSPGT